MCAADPIPAERSLVAAFATLEDPRCPINRRHRLGDMIVLAVAAVLAGADGWQDVERFGRAKEAWFRQFLALPHGIPSHDTFGRVFALLDPQAFERCFRNWVAAICALLPGEIIAVDGKTLRRSHDRNAGLAALHLVSAWATANRVVLGQVATEAKSNEITAIPQLLALLHLQGCIVTIDAMGCQTKIAEQINAQGAHYVLALKGNQGTLATEVEDAFISADAKDYAGMDAPCLETVERGHGRVETRRYRTLGDLSGVPRSALWQGMNMIGMVESQRTVDGKTTVETRYYIGSIGTDVACFARAVRGHWGVENVLHWSLDMTFREDACRVRQPAARENLAVLRRIALTRLKQDNAKLSLRNKRNTAGWDHRYLAKLLFDAPSSLSSA
jgi:predicted transposase YbfD/YdcC